jgi:hypothetical protein
MTYTKRRYNRKKSIKRRKIKRKNKKGTKMKGGSLANSELFINQKLLHDIHSVKLEGLTLTLDHLIKICDKKPSLLTMLTDTDIENIKLEPITPELFASTTNLLDEINKELKETQLTSNAAIAFAGNGKFRNSLIERKYGNLFLKITNMGRNACKRKIVKIVCKKLYKTDILDEDLNSFIEMMDNLDDKPNNDEFNEFVEFFKTIKPSVNKGGGFRKNINKKKKKSKKKMKGGAIAIGFLFLVGIIITITGCLYYRDKRRQKKIDKHVLNLNSPWFVEVSEFDRDTEYTAEQIKTKLNMYPQNAKIVSINLLQKGIEWDQRNTNDNRTKWNETLGGHLPGTFVIRGTNESGIAYKLSYVDKEENVKHLNIMEIGNPPKYKLQRSSRDPSTLEDLVDNYKAQWKDSQTENDGLNTRLYVYNKFGIFVKYNEKKVTDEIYYLYEIVNKSVNAHLYRIEKTDKTKTIIGPWVRWEYIRKKLIEHVVNDINENVMEEVLNYKAFEPIYNL